MGLTPDGRALFKSLLAEQRANSVPYQLVNEIGYNKPIDKVVSQFEDVLFYESDYKYLLGIESRKAELEIYLDERAKKEKEIAGLRAKVAPNLVEKEEHYKTLVSQIVTDLKIDLQTPGRGGRKILDEIVKITRRVASSTFEITNPKAVVRTGVSSEP